MLTRKCVVLCTRRMSLQREDSFVYDESEDDGHPDGEYNDRNDDGHSYYTETDVDGSVADSQFETEYYSETEYTDEYTEYTESEYG